MNSIRRAWLGEANFTRITSKELKSLRKLPPHLAKFFDDKGNLKPEVAKRMKKDSGKSKVTDVTPKGYGPKEDTIDEAKMSASQISKLQKAYEPMRGKTIDLKNAGKLSDIMKAVQDDKKALIQLYKADIPFISKLSLSKLVVVHNMKAPDIYKAINEEVKQVSEDGHTDVASAVRQCKTTIEDVSQILSKLQGMNPEDDLPSWWMNKIAISANSMNKLRDYLLVPSTNEEKDELDVNEVFSPKEIKMAIGIASDKRYAGGNYSGAVRTIEKIKKGLSNHKQVSAVLKRQNEGMQESRILSILSLRKNVKDLLEANYNDNSKVKDFTKEKKPVETILKTITSDNKIKAFLKNKPRFDSVLYMDGDDLIMGDSLVLSIKDGTKISDIKKAILKVK